MTETIPFHPACGYATEEQIEQLKKLGHGPDYNQLWKTIEKQHATKGKKK